MKYNRYSSAEGVVFSHNLAQTADPSSSFYLSQVAMPPSSVLT